MNDFSEAELSITLYLIIRKSGCQVWYHNLMRIPRLGWPIITMLTLIPLLLWMHILPLSDRFADLATTEISIGQLTGIVGVVLFAISLIFSARIKLYDPLFGGINRAYIVHAQIGGIALLLLMVHPLIISLVLLPSLRQVAAFFLPGGSWVMNLGIASLLLLMALLIVTYYTNIPYNVWKKTHQFLGLAFLLGAVHGFYVDSDISRTPILGAYIMVLTILGTISYIYRTILGKILVKRYPYLVSEVTTRSDNITQISFVPEHTKLMMFEPGQFVFISLRLPGVSSEAHPFSIASVPIPNGFLISIKSLGDYTGALATIPVGTRAYVEGPYGKFSLEKGKKSHMIWIAGGIGITPFLSMAASMPAGCSADLYYCVATPEEAVYLPELEALAKEVIGLRVYPWYSKTQGRISASIIAKTSGTIAQRNFFLCGPQGLMHSLRQQLVAIGVKDRAINSEEFAMFNS